MFIWRLEGSISATQVILTFEVSYAVEMLPSGRQINMTFFSASWVSLITIKFIAYPLDGLDVVVAHLFAHFAHVHIHGAGQHKHIVAPDILQ